MQGNTISRETQKSFITVCSHYTVGRLMSVRACAEVESPWASTAANYLHKSLHSHTNLSLHGHLSLQEMFNCCQLFAQFFARIHLLLTICTTMFLCMGCSTAANYLHKSLDGHNHLHNHLPLYGIISPLLSAGCNFAAPQIFLLNKMARCHFRETQ